MIVVVVVVHPASNEFLYIIREINCKYVLTIDLLHNTYAHLKWYYHVFESFSESSEEQHASFGADMYRISWCNPQPHQFYKDSFNIRISVYDTFYIWLFPDFYTPFAPYDPNFSWAQQKLDDMPTEMIQQFD